VGERKDHRKLREDEPRPHDRLGPYSRQHLIRMDRRFAAAVERAFRTGAESPEAAGRMALARLR
jgi:hypothetical protein